MRVHCVNCEAPYLTSLSNLERYGTALCRMCRHETRLDVREVPAPRLFGLEVDMGRWFGGLIPRWSEQGRHKVDRKR